MVNQNCASMLPRLEGGTRGGGAAVRVPRRRCGLVRCLVVPAAVPTVVPAVPVPVSAVMLVVATPVVVVVVIISPVVVVRAAHAAGKDLEYLHAAPPYVPGTALLRP